MHAALYSGRIKHVRTFFAYANALVHNNIMYNLFVLKMQSFAGYAQENVYGIFVCFAGMSWQFATLSFTLST